MVFTGVDVGVAVLVLISAILATARGFTREILSLATWAGAAAIAAYMYFYHKDLAEKYIDNPLVATGVTVVGTFLVALIVLHLLTMWIGDMVVDSRIGPLDRTLGFLFGLARGLIIVVIAFLFFAWLVPDNRQPDWVQSAKSKVVLQGTGNWLIGMLPEDPETTILKRLKKPKPEDQESDAPGQKSESGAPATTTGTRAQ